MGLRTAVEEAQELERNRDNPGTTSVWGEELGKEEPELGEGTGRMGKEKWDAS